MTFQEAIVAVFRKYAEFTGRAGRPEFWWWVLFSTLVSSVLNAFNVFTPEGTVYVGASLSGVWGLAVLLPSLAVTVRRLRDAGRQWTELFWLLLPLVGLIILIVHLCEPSKHDALVGPVKQAAVPVPVTKKKTSE